MDVDEILQVLIEAVSQVQENGLREIPELCSETLLIGDVPGCDSLVVMEISMNLTRDLASILGKQEIPDEILLGENNRSRPTLGEIATSIGEIADGNATGQCTQKSAMKKNASKNSASKSCSISESAQFNGALPIPSPRQNRKNSKAISNGFSSQLPFNMNSTPQEQSK